jgi:hypothetical protein
MTSTRQGERAMPLILSTRYRVECSDHRDSEEVPVSVTPTSLGIFIQEAASSLLTITAAPIDMRWQRIAISASLKVRIPAS